MSADVEELEGRLSGLRSERDSVASTKTREDAAAAARSYGEAARRDEVAGLILNQHSHGEPLQRVLNAYTASGSRLTFDEWLVQAAQSVEGVTLTNRQRDSRLRKLESQIKQASAELREAEEAAAVAEVRARFEREAARRSELDLAQIADREFAGDAA